MTSAKRNVLAALSLVVVLHAAPVRAGELFVSGFDSAHQVTEAPTGDIRAIAQGGALQGLAIRQDRTLVLWGAPPLTDPFTIPPGGLGDPVAIPPIPPELAGETFVAAGIGRFHAMAIRPDGTVAAWGNRLAGDIEAPPGVRFRAVVAGTAHTIGLARGGRLYGWGDGRAGQTDVPDGRFKAVGARRSYSIALRKDGTLFGWGTPDAGTGTFAMWTPDGDGHFYVEGEKFTAIAAGNGHVVALRTDGTVAGWGAPSGGVLEAPSGVQFKAVAAGSGFSVGLGTDGTLYGWGTPVAPPGFPPGAHRWNFDTAPWRDIDAQHHYVPGETFKVIAAAAFHVSALTVDDEDGADDADGEDDEDE